MRRRDLEQHRGNSPSGVRWKAGSAVKTRRLSVEAVRVASDTLRPLGGANRLHVLRHSSQYRVAPASLIGERGRVPQSATSRSEVGARRLLSLGFLVAAASGQGRRIGTRLPADPAMLPNAGRSARSAPAVSRTVSTPPHRGRTAPGARVVIGRPMAASRLGRSTRPLILRERTRSGQEAPGPLPRQAFAADAARSKHGDG